MAMRNRFNWVTEGSQLLPAEAIGGTPEDDIALQINFVSPSRKEEPPAPPIIDAEPSAYPSDAKPELRPARA
jgi:hypothetical protein